MKQKIEKFKWWILFSLMLVAGVALLIVDSGLARGFCLFMSGFILGMDYLCLGSALGHTFPKFGKWYFEESEKSKPLK